MKADVDVPALLARLGIQWGGLRWLNAPCPSRDHDDSRPSWRILDDPNDPQHGRHHCYGCGFGGYPVHLVEEVLQVSREEAWSWLRSGNLRRNHHALYEPELVVRSVGRQAIRLELEQVAFDDLLHWPTPPGRYAERRGLTAEQVRRWRVGHASDGRLRGRIVFVARTRLGEARNYTARTYSDQQPKYLTPNARRESYDLSMVYGEEHWTVEDRSSTALVVTEGALNGLAVERASERVFGRALPFGALGGSQLDGGQVTKLAGWPRIVLAVDRDKAGSKVGVVLRGALARHCRLAELEQPEGVDCNDLDAKGELDARLRSAILALDGRASDGARRRV